MTGEYIEKILHREVQIVPYEELGKLPLSIQGSYDISLITIMGQTALIAEPKEKTPLVTLRKQQRQMAIYTGLPCVLYLTEMNYYARDALLEEGIPFVWEGHQLYMPFIGVLLDDYQRTNISVCTQISYLTQRLLLTALYQGWKDVTVTRAAEILDVSKMSITRCFDELETLNNPYLSVRNRKRRFTADTDKRAMWENIREILRNPVLKSYALKRKPDIKLPLSGETALAHYSMLDEGAFPFYAVTKDDLKRIVLSGRKLASAGETPGCVIQELGYWIPYEQETAADPLTVALSISEDEKNDPRVSMAIDEMLEEHVW